MGSLTLRMAFLVGIFFGILYIIISTFMSLLGVGSFVVYILLGVVIVSLQYFLGPKLVELTMRVKYITPQENPELYTTVEELAREAGIPTPRVGISYLNIPNAFAFGRGIADSRVCVTQGILHLLDKDELRAVLGHEITHIRNRDVLFITFLSVIPLILYRIAFHFLFWGPFMRRRENSVAPVMIGLIALILYFITNLLVLYASRIREYFADKGSVDLGNPPAALASALYKLVYGCARLPREELKEAEGIKAFFLNDPSQSRNEIAELSELDLDRSGTIDPFELEELKKAKIKLSFQDKLVELLRTHPNMLKRIKALSLYQGS